MGTGVFYLLKERKFLPFFLTQFFGVFNDNAFKLAMLTLISYSIADTQSHSEFYQALAGALFIAPFFLFSATAGQLADKYNKALIIRQIKFLELVLMIMGSFALCKGNIFLLMCTLTGLGLHSAFFGPVKYAILPDHLAPQHLLGATGLVESSTFLAILLGTTLGALAVKGTSAIPYLAIFMTVLVAVAGLIASFFIPSTVPSSSNLTVDFHFWRSSFKMIKHAATQQGIFLAILILSWFWLTGSVVLMKLPDYTHYVLHANPAIFSLFLFLFSIGIALGSLTVNYILQGRLTVALVPWAMLGFSCFISDLYWASPSYVGQKPLFMLSTFFTFFSHWRIAFDLFMLAFCAGLFIVPLYTYLQVASPPESRARTIAANNIYNALFMVLGTLGVMALLHFNMSIPQVFLILSLLNLGVTLYVWFFLNKLK